MNASYVAKYAVSTTQNTKYGVLIEMKLTISNFHEFCYN